MNYWLILFTLIGSPANVGSQVPMTQPVVSAMVFKGATALADCRAQRDLLVKTMGQYAACVPDPYQTAAVAGN